MTQPYIDVTEFVEHEHKLISDGTYQYIEDLYGIIQPLSPKYDFEFFGDFKKVGVDSPFPIHHLIDIPEGDIKRAGMIGNTLVVLGEDFQVHLYHFGKDSKGEFIDDVYLASTFDSEITDSSITDVVFSGDGAIFLKDNKEAIFHNIPVPTNLDNLINNRFIRSVAVNKDKHFCLVFEDSTVLFYNGDKQNAKSYDVIPQSIINYEDYHSFDTEKYKNPSEITNAIDVIAHSGFSILTIDGNIIVWGDEFQDMNNDAGSFLLPVKNDDIVELIGSGHNFGLALNDNGDIVVWGDDANGILTKIKKVKDHKHVITLPTNIVYTTGHGKETHFADDTFTNSNPIFSDMGNFYTKEDLEELQYLKHIAYSNDGFLYTFSQHDNQDHKPVRIDFKLRKHDDKFYIPIMHFMEYEPANINLEVYSKCKSEYESIGRNIDFTVVDTYDTKNGVADFSKIVITPSDKDRNGVPDDPLAYKMIVDDDDFIIMETYVDNNGLESTRISIDTILLSDTLYFEPEVMYYADIERRIVDHNGDEHVYAKGSFYKGDSLIDGVIPNTATIIKDKYDDETGVMYIIEKGRSFTKDDPFKFQWTHYSSGGEDRIDPSVSNIMDMYVLTNSYHNDVQRWLRSNASMDKFPVAPTPELIRNDIKFIERYKSTSDQMIYIPAEYKLLFGDYAKPEYRADFKIIKLDGATLTDNEIKSKTIEAINDYFNIDNWDFGDSFYFTELAAHIHNWLSGHVASVVIVPEFESATFGDLFQIKCEPHELFLSTAKVNNVVITNQYTSKNLRKMR